MTPILSSLMKSGRVALVALTLGAATITAMPAQAASEPSFSFQLGIGSGGDVKAFGGAKSKGFHPIRICLTDRQVERGLRHYGFRDVDVVKRLNKSRVLVFAEYGRRDYSMKVNKCTGAVYDIERLRRGDRFPGRDRDFNSGRPGFGLEFSFGN